MTEGAAYPEHKRAKVNRHRDRAKYDFGTIHAIVNTSSILHVSFLPTDPSTDPFPTTLPMIGQMGSFDDRAADPAAEPLDLYLHGYSTSRLMRLPDSSSTGEEGTPLCVSATLLDGIVLALTPFSHSCNYRSAVIHGYATPVTDDAEKLYALQLITDGLVPDRWDRTRLPPSKVEMQTTQILKVRVQSASAKVRAGQPSDDRKDLKDEDLMKRVWTGVVPVRESFGKPEAGDNNRAGDCPEYLERWLKEKNEVGERYAQEAAVKKYK